jgi:hypothetical protein
MLTENNGIEYKVYVPTNLKYKKLGIKLYRKDGYRWENSIECENNIIPAPLDLLNYEKKFLV